MNQQPNHKQETGMK